MAERNAGRTGRGGSLGRAVAGLAVGTLALTGCVSTPQDREVTDEPWTPATTEALTSWMKAYDEATASAAPKGDIGAIKTITGNVQQRAVKAEYRLVKQSGSEPAPEATVTHTKPEFFLPVFENYPLWAMAASVNAKSGHQVLDLLDRQTAGTDWRKMVSVELDDGQQVPELERAGDSVVSAPLNKPGELRRSPAKVARALGGLLAATSASSPFAIFTQHPVINQHMAQNADRAALAEQGLATIEHKPADLRVVRALTTVDGGALMLVGLREKEELQLSGTTLSLPEDSAVRAFTGEDTITESLKVTRVWQAAVLLPPKSAPPETKAKVLGVRFDVVRASVT